MGSKGDLLRVLDLVAAGRLRPVLGERLPFDHLPDAHRMLEDRAVFGKVVIEAETP
jgi:NADPH:quinone reductase-like Zn-dependent oxidoreductase